MVDLILIISEGEYEDTVEMVLRSIKEWFRNALLPETSSVRRKKLRDGAKSEIEPLSRRNLTGRRFCVPAKPVRHANNRVFLVGTPPKNTRRPAGARYFRVAASRSLSSSRYRGLWSPIDFLFRGQPILELLKPSENSTSEACQVLFELKRFL